MKFHIGPKTVGKDFSCFVIAEAGVNHNGDIKVAKQLIDAAVYAKADAIKFQIVKADSLYVKDAGKFKTDYGDEFDIHEVWKNVEVNEQWLQELSKYCHEKNIIFLSSVFDEEGADKADLYMDAYKVASSELTHIPLLKHIAKKAKPIIISTGGATLDEIIEAVNCIYSTGNKNLAILYCVVKYPTPLAEANILALDSLKKQFPNVVIGYSDHSLNPVKVPAAAVANGAKIIEKHFTISRNLSGIDHKMSLEPDELKQMVDAIRNAEKSSLNIDKKLLGDGKIDRFDSAEVMKFVRRKLFVVKPLVHGQEFTRENLKVLRPGNRNELPGVHPREYENIIGMKATKSLPANHMLDLEDVA